MSTAADCVHCPSGKLDEDGFCAFCGLTTHSRRVPGTPSPAELARIVRTDGMQRALMVATLDAIYAALKPGKASLK